MLADVGFEELHIAVGYLIVGQFIGMQGDGDDLAFVVAATDATDTAVEHCGLNLLCHFLCADEHGGIVSEEGTEMVDVIPSGLLVGYHAAYRWLMGCIQLNQTSDGLPHLDALAPEAVAHVEEQGVEDVVGQGMVNLTAMDVACPIWQGHNPLPVAEMT